MKTGGTAYRLIGSSSDAPRFRPRTAKTRDRHTERAEALRAATPRFDKPMRRIARQAHIISRSGIRAMLIAAQQERALGRVS